MIFTIKNLNISPCIIKLSDIIVSDLIYNQTTSGNAYINNSIIIGNDIVTLQYDSCIFPSQNVGNYENVMLSNIHLSGTGYNSLKYTLVDSNNIPQTYITSYTTSGKIIPITLVATFTASDKIYDGNMNANVSYNLTDFNSFILDGDTVQLSDTYKDNAFFVSKNAGSNVTVQISNIQLINNDYGNYTIDTTATTTASLNPGLR